MSSPPKCTATSKRTGQPCGARAVRGRSVCYHHGGRSGLGVAAPSFQHGRYSKYLPARLMERYATAQADMDLIALREEIALLDARLTEVLQRVDSGESGALWLGLKGAYREYQKADAACKLVEREDAQAKIHDLIEQGLTDYAVWSDVRALIQERRLLVESERKRLEAMQVTVTAERVMALFTAITASIKRHVTDRRIVLAISNDLEALLRANPETARAAG